MYKEKLIRQSNKEAFKKSLKPVKFNKEEAEYIEDIIDDQRENTDERGTIVNCYYCGTCIRIDGYGDDYPEPEQEIHCDECMGHAILTLTM